MACEREAAFRLLSVRAVSLEIKRRALVKEYSISGELLAVCYSPLREPIGGLHSN